MNDDMPSPIRSEALAAIGISHAFFTREGGVSSGPYATLNGGVGSKDEPAAVAENRRRMAATLGVMPTHLMVPYQIHSASVEIVEAPWAADARPRVDAVVTATPGIGLGVTGADCGIVLFADRKAKVVGAAHAGWKGALYGVLEAAVGAMESIGAARRSLVAVLGPTIGRNSYEVGAEYRERFLTLEAGSARFFTESSRSAHYLFDLPGYITARLRAARIGDVQDLGLDTYGDEARFFSYRRSVHRREADYGRLVAAIALA